jgi:hypothetical protein
MGLAPLVAMLGVQGMPQALENWGCARLYSALAVVSGFDQY